MSEEKCSASACSASLDVALATRLSEPRARKKSTAIEPAMIIKAAERRINGVCLCADEALRGFP